MQVLRDDTETSVRMRAPQGKDWLAKRPLGVRHWPERAVSRS